MATKKTSAAAAASMAEWAFGGRESATAVVAARLMDEIRAGVWAPGDKLPTERALAGELGVSRSSLREALRALEILGLLHVRQGSGVYVSTLDPETLLMPLHYFVSLAPANVEALFEARIALETQIAGLAAERISTDHLVEMSSLLMDEPKTPAGIERFIEADVAFHRLISEAADSPILARMVKSVEVLGRASRGITGYSPGLLKRSARDHRAILTALKARDSERAARAMKAHLRNVREAYRKQVALNAKTKR